MMFLVSNEKYWTLSIYVLVRGCFVSCRGNLMLVGRLIVGYFVVHESALRTCISAKGLKIHHNTTSLSLSHTHTHTHNLTYNQAHCYTHAVPGKSLLVGKGPHHRNCIGVDITILPVHA